MANWSDPRFTPAGQAGAGYDAEAQQASYDEGLRAHMLSIYNYMASAVLLTGIVALLVASSSTLMSTIFGTPLRWVVMFSPLAIVFAMSFGANRMSAGVLQALFWVYATLVGASLSVIFYAYTGPSIALTFFSTAAAFASLSLWGYTTKKDLSGWGSFLIMGLVGIIIASLFNLFLGSGTLSLVISGLGVLIFAGLTAYDTQRLKSEYFYLRGTEWAGKAVIMGALNLYLDFINMFLFLLRFLGSSQE